MSLVVGVALKVATDIEAYPELAAQIEQTAKRAFAYRHGFEATTVTWAYEAAHIVDDPDTGDDVQVPALWVCLAEGTKPQ